MIISDKFKIKSIFKSTYNRLSKKQLMIYAHIYGLRKFRMWFWTKNRIRTHIMDTIKKGTTNATT